MDLRSTLLRPLKKAAVRVVYRDKPTYAMKLRGKETVYSIQGPAESYFFYAHLAFGRILERPVTNAMIDDLEQASCFADIGANMGYYTALARNFMPGEGQVHTFEMDAENHGILERNVGLNPSSVRVSANNVAVSNVAGTVSYERSVETASPVLSLYQIEEAAEGGAAQPQGEMITFEVPAITLDSYFAEKGVYPDLVKLDVEGAEVHVLQGMGEVLPRVRRMYVELHPRKLAVAGHTPQDALDLLAPHFDLHVIPGHRAQEDRIDWQQITADAPITENTIVLAVAKGGTA